MIRKQVRTYDKQSYQSKQYAKIPVHLWHCSSNYLRNTDEDLNVDKVSIIFAGGLPTEGYIPNLNIAIEPLLPDDGTNDEFVDTSIQVIKSIVQD